eukprot:9948245-Prorocentrum_lima.AAC.1
MTSSLVGSEMCIRDRSRTTDRTESSSTKEVANRLDLDKLNQDVGDRPVSYTHLTLPTICSV